MEAPPVAEDESKKDKPLYTFKHFMRMPKLVLGGIGIIFWPRGNYLEHKWFILNFFVSLFSITLAVVCELWYAIDFFRKSNNMIEGTDLMIYVIYSLLSEIKILSIFKNLKRINTLISTLNDLFPVTEQQQEAFNVKKYYRRVRLLTVPIVSMMWCNVSFFSGTTVYFFFKTDPEDYASILQYYFWYPFKINTATRFIGAFIQQIHASQMVTLCVLGSDVLLTCILLQICMHLDELSSRFDQVRPGRGNLKDLSAIIYQQDFILRLMDEVNELFASSVFITFLSSAFVMCFVGFQVVIGASGFTVMKFVFFLIYELLKVFQTSLLADLIMEASFNIGESAYRSKWYEKSVEYQKVILLIICRAQRPANLNAITLHEVCLITFKEIASKAYTFFALLRTMYND